MATVQVEVYLDGFDTDDLICELSGRKLRKAEVDLLAAILEKHRPTVRVLDEANFQEAVDDLRSGMKREAIHHLEQALPKEWWGVLTREAA